MTHLTIQCYKSIKILTGYSLRDWQWQIIWTFFFWWQIFICIYHNLRNVFTSYLFTFRWMKFHLLVFITIVVPSDEIPRVYVWVIAAFTRSWIQKVLICKIKKKKSSLSTQRWGGGGGDFFTKWGFER